MDANSKQKKNNKLCPKINIFSIFFLFSYHFAPNLNCKFLSILISSYFSFVCDCVTRLECLQLPVIFAVISKRCSCIFNLINFYALTSFSLCLALVTSHWLQYFCTNTHAELSLYYRYIYECIFIDKCICVCANVY